jgi:hypothetical protein
MTQQTYDTTREQPTGWVGWIFFAGTMMVIGGGLNLFYGIVAAFNDDWVLWQNGNAVFVDISNWGWAHIVIGAIVLLAGFGVMTGNVLARTIGVIVAAISLIANFFVIPLYPLWSLTIIVIDVLVIWALTAHGRELRA